MKKHDVHFKIEYQSQPGADMGPFWLDITYGPTVAYHTITHPTLREAEIAVAKLTSEHDFTKYRIVEVRCIETVVMGFRGTKQLEYFELK
jgi:hypothetical protein